MIDNVTEITQAEKDCNNIVTDLIKIRKSANFSQEFMADWLGVSRKKLSEFENGEPDFKLMLKYADKLSVNVRVHHYIH